MDDFEAGIRGECHGAIIPEICSQRALRIVDDSMAPLFPPGTILIVDRDSTPAFGNFVLARPGCSQEMFGKLVNENGKKYIKPVNPGYPSVLLDGDSTIDGVARRVIFDVE